MFKTYIKRDVYIDKIRPFINKDVIKVLVGQRRVGKSYLLFQIIDEIKRQTIPMWAVSLTNPLTMMI